MQPDPNDPPEPLRLPDDVAHRLLARAIEVDQRPLEISVAQLRSAAIEAGISEDAFDRALAEMATLRARPSPPTLWQRVTGWIRPHHRPSHQTIWERLAASGIAFALFLVLFGVINRAASASGVPWQVQHLGQVLVELLGVGMALRLRARVVTLGLAGVAVAQLAGFVMHLLSGIQTVQGGPTQFALIIAGVVGVALGRLLSAPAYSGPGTIVRPAETPEREASPVERDPHRLLSLRAYPVPR